MVFTSLNGCGEEIVEGIWEAAEVVVEEWVGVKEIFKRITTSEKLLEYIER